jgi:hypothetical protein
VTTGSLEEVRDIGDEKEQSDGRKNDRRAREQLVEVIEWRLRVDEPLFLVRHKSIQLFFVLLITERSKSIFQFLFQSHSES